MRLRESGFSEVGFSPQPNHRDLSSRPAGCGLPQPEAEGSAFEFSLSS